MLTFQSMLTTFITSQQAFVQSLNAMLKMQEGRVALFSKLLSGLEIRKNMLASSTTRK